MIKYIKLHSGFAEDGSVSSIEFYHAEGVKTRFDLLQQIARVSLAAHEARTKFSHLTRECCKGVQTPFCPTCGQRSSAVPDFYAIASSFFGFVGNLWNESCDSFPQEFYDFGLNSWPSMKEILALGTEQVLEVSEFGPEFVCLALGTEGTGGSLREKEIAKVLWGRHEDCHIPYFPGESREAFIQHINDNLPS